MISSIFDCEINHEIDLTMHIFFPLAFIECKKKVRMRSLELTQMPNYSPSKLILKTIKLCLFD